MNKNIILKDYYKTGYIPDNIEPQFIDENGIRFFNKEDIIWEDDE